MVPLLFDCPAFHGGLPDFMYGQPTRASSFGCVVGWLGLCASGIGLWAVWGMTRVGFDDDPDKRAEVLWKLGIIGGIALLIGVVLIFLGWRSARNCDMRDPTNPRKPWVRF